MLSSNEALKELIEPIVLSEHSAYINLYLRAELNYTWINKCHVLVVKQIT